MSQLLFPEEIPVSEEEVQAWPRRMISLHAKRSCACVVNQIVRFLDGLGISFCFEPEPLYFRRFHVARMPVFFGVFVSLIKFLTDVLREIASELVALPLFVRPTPMLSWWFYIDRT